MGVAKCHVHNSDGGKKSQQKRESEEEITKVFKGGVRNYRYRLRQRNERIEKIKAANARRAIV